MKEVLPPNVRAKYHFQCFGKGGGTAALLNLTVSGAQPVAAIQHVVKEVGCVTLAYPTHILFGQRLIVVQLAPSRQEYIDDVHVVLCETTAVDQQMFSALPGMLSNSGNSTSSNPHKYAFKTVRLTTCIFFLAGIRLQSENQAHLLLRVFGDEPRCRLIPRAGGCGEWHPSISPLYGEHGDVLRQVLRAGEIGLVSASINRDLLLLEYVDGCGYILAAEKTSSWLSLSLPCSSWQVKPLLVREICNRSPGASFSIDATFKLAKISTGHASCIVFVLGELGHIITWAAIRSDKWSNVLPILYA